MTTPTNWPNPERPGVPLFHERLGWHLLSTKKHYEMYSIWEHELWLWSPEKRHYSHEAKRITENDAITLGCSYGGPVLTPAQIAEMLAEERERCARICNDIGAQASLHISELSNRTHGALLAQPEKGRMDAAYECAGRIRNLGATP